MERIQYISQGATVEEQLTNIKNALRNGIKWIQLRAKKLPAHELITLGQSTKKLCLEHNALFIINDHVQFVNTVEADGVHLGLNDLCIHEARQILGKNKIIGGTANTFNEVLQRIDESCDYIGLGPLRHTATKEKLSPLLGLEGYQHILDDLKLKSVTIPKIYAIGSVIPEDIPALHKMGIYGVAISKLITEQPQIINELKELIK